MPTLHLPLHLFSFFSLSSQSAIIHRRGFDCFELTRQLHGDESTSVDILLELQCRPRRYAPSRKLATLLGLGDEPREESHQHMLKALYGYCKTHGLLEEEPSAEHVRLNDALREVTARPARKASTALAQLTVIGFMARGTEKAESLNAIPPPAPSWALR